MSIARSSCFFVPENRKFGVGHELVLGVPTVGVADEERAQPVRD
jgi:hypothetical protein